jgi:hypothetical protein
MTKSLRIMPIDYESPVDREADMSSLIVRLERQGRLRTVQPIKMVQARALYCRKLRDKRTVAAAVGVSVGDLDRWIMTQGWDELRHKTEFKYYQRVTNIRRKAVPDIDAKHDLGFHNLEGLIEDTIHRLKQQDVTLPTKDLVALANAYKTCMESRRVIAKKEGPVKRHVLEMADPELFNEFAGALIDSISNGEPAQIQQGEREVIKQIPFTIEDQDLESQKDNV